MVSNDKSPIRVAVVQDGARGHYGLPIALNQAGLLWQVYTDFYCIPGGMSERLARFVRRFKPGLGQRMLERQTAELRPEQVRFGYRNLLKQLSGKRKHATSQSYWEWQATVQGRWMLRNGIAEADAVIGMVRNLCPDFCRRMRELERLVVADQMIAPAAIEHQQMQIQEQRFPGWNNADPPEMLKRIDDLERRTWNNVDHITCPSEYVATGLNSLGIPRQRISVVNYSIDVGDASMVDRSRRNGPVRVGFVGHVGLRKGTPYFLEVARRFDPARVRFTMVGPIQIEAGVLERHRGHVEILGARPRQETAELMRQMDLIYFPTTCEGSAYALLEAMACGLPIVTSLNSGTIGRDNVEVFICAYDDLDAAERHIRRLVHDVDLRLSMGRAARKRFEEGNLAAYSRSLRRLFDSLLGRPNPKAQ